MEHIRHQTEGAMKNILIITYHFPPKSEIGGIRLYGLAKYLQEFGWKPIILTTTLPGKPDSSLEIIQVPSIDVVALWKKRFFLNPDQSLNTQFNLPSEKNKPSIANRLAFLPNEIITYPDSQIGWYDSAVSTGHEIIRSENIDVILSSSSPVTAHLIAQNLSKKYHTPWIADFRDLWTQNHYFNHTRIRKYFETRLEVKTIKQASAITTVSEPLAQKLSELHRNKVIYSIPNGFDPTLIDPGIPIKDRFSIVYTGALYQGKRDPAQLFEAIHFLRNNGLIGQDDVQIDMYGPHENWLQNDIEKYHLEDIVTLNGIVTRERAIIEQQRAQLLLLLTWNNPAEEGVYTGKLFEYLAAHRPILSLGYTDGGVVKELLDQTQAGVHCSNEAELREYLFKAYQEYKELGAVQYRGIEAEVMKYSHREMARKFAEVLEEVTHHYMGNPMTDNTVRSISDT